ncbi:MAG: helix-turn-helix domain-containing protein [Chloroflexi bacterium]|nr:helix-turn-helix domain-containing protein [Chloroflexota bacterium]
MRTIGRVDFEVGHSGHIHQDFLDAVPEDGAVDYVELASHLDKRAIAEGVLPLDQVLDKLVDAGYLEKKRVGATLWVLRRRWLSSAEAAERLGLSQRTIQAWQQQGRLQTRRIGSRLRFSEVDIEALREGGLNEAVIAGNADPVLTELWDNDADAAYDKL